MNIVFFGSSSFSIPVLDSLIRSRHEVVLVVTTPDRKQGRGQQVKPSLVKSFSENHRLSVISPEKLNVPDVVEKVKLLGSDFLVIASYGKMVPSSIFTLPKAASLNVHPSLLPKYRGASPIQSALLNGDAITGVSIAEVTKDLDAGDLFGQVQTEISPDENAGELSERLSRLGSALLSEVIARFESGNVSRTPQNGTQATFTTKLDKNLGRIDWKKPALYIHNQIRACNPLPSAYTFFQGGRLKILKAIERLSPPSPLPSPPDGGRGAAAGDEPRQGRGEGGEHLPGSIILCGRRDPLCVQANPGIVEISMVQLEGRRIMSAPEFALGQRIKAGDRFDS